MRWFACILALGLLLAGGCELDRKVLLRWSDPEGGAQFLVGTRDRLSGTQVFLEVTREGKTSVNIVAKNVEVHRLSLVRFNDWVLVMSGKYVVGGYDYGTRQIHGMESASLPFTKRTVAGDEVAAVKIDDGEDVAPSGTGWTERPDR